MKKVVGAYWKKDLLRDLLKIFVAGVLAALVYVAFNSINPEFTHGYVTFVIPLCACGAVYLAALLASGVLKRLMKR